MTGRDLSSFTSAASSSATLPVSVFAMATITSPSRKPARAAGPSALSTRTPLLRFSSFLSAGVRSESVKPRALAVPAGCGLAGSGADGRDAVRSGSSSATVMLSSRCEPRRNTVMRLLLPGRVLPTSRGRSTDLSISVPSKRRMMSPGSSPALAAGESFSTPRTKAPRGRPRPMDSATSLLT
ncbi:hypothetical protein FQZ97_985620 [compost metagenome]